MSDKLRIAKQFISALPYSKALGMALTELHDGVAIIEMPYNSELVGDPRTGVLHGGAVSAVMDTCCGAAVMSHPSNPGATATIDLRIEYLRAAKPGQKITARAECYHVTRSVAFVRASAQDEEQGSPVATATGSFTVEGNK